MKLFNNYYVFLDLIFRFEILFREVLNIMLFVDVVRRKEFSRVFVEGFFWFLL